MGSCQWAGRHQLGQVNSYFHYREDQRNRGPIGSLVTVRRFRKRKICCHAIAISQAGIAAPTPTVMQGFQTKKNAASISFTISQYSVNTL